jgi:hypothetical protein
VKVLLDENVPRNLAALLPNHEVTTVTDKGWIGLSNGELLDAAERESLDVFVTGDKTIQYEQNIVGRKLAVLSLSTNSGHLGWRRHRLLCRRLTPPTQVTGSIDKSDLSSR